MKASSSHKGPYEFDTLQCVQEMHGEHLGPIWCMKFSPCGRLLATAGQDRILRIWVLKTAFNHFQDMRSRCNADNKSSPTPSQESLVSQHSIDDPVAAIIAEKESDPRSPFVERPFCTYSAHTSDLLDVSWSKVNSLLTPPLRRFVKLNFSFCRIILFCLHRWIRRFDFGTYLVKSASAAFNISIS